jgi:hypothetical protein
MLNTTRDDFPYEDSEDWWGRVEEDGHGGGSRGRADRSGGYHNDRGGDDSAGIPLQDLEPRTFE